MSNIKKAETNIVLKIWDLRSKQTPTETKENIREARTTEGDNPVINA